MDRRSFLLTLPALAAAPQLLAQATLPAPFRVNGLSQITLTVSDVARSLDFYQGLFGMPVQARQGSTVLLRIGDGPRFLALRQAASGERPRISAFGFGVHDFSIDRAMQALASRGITAAPSTADTPGPKQMLVRTRDLFVADPSGVVFQLHDVNYCGGNVCTAEPSPKPGLIALKDTNHFTIVASDPGTVQMYRSLFGFQPLAYQATTPAWQVGTGVHFLMFIGGTAGGPAREPGIDHACVSMENFDPAAVTKLLVAYGLKQQDSSERSPLVTYITRRMPNRGGAEGGTPELYFTDPDSLAIQIQDVTYCGGGGVLGEVCPPLP